MTVRQSSAAGGLFPHPLNRRTARDTECNRPIAPGAMRRDHVTAGQTLGLPTRKTPPIFTRPDLTQNPYGERMLRTPEPPTDQTPFFGIRLLAPTSTAPQGQHQDARCRWTVGMVQSPSSQG
jgi:hypothetical protein